MNVGEKVTIGGKDFNVLFTYENYVLVSLIDAEPENVANGTFVFEIGEGNNLTLIKDKEKIKLVITKLFEAAQSRK